MGTPVPSINIHATLFFIETKDFQAVVSFGAEEFSEAVFGAFLLACEMLDFDPDDYPVKGKDWSAQTLGKPLSAFMRNTVVLAVRT